MPTVLVMFALLAMTQDSPAEPPDDPEITVTDTAPLAHPLCTPAKLPPVLLPVRRLYLDASGNLAFTPSPKPRSTFWAEVGVGGARTRTCDPFGRFDTECADRTGPSAFIGIGDDRLRLEAGATLTGANGRILHASLRGRIASPGPVRVGLALEGTDLSWSRPVFTGGNTTLGTDRRAQAAFMGLDLGWGDYHAAHARVVLLPGYWRSTYHGTLSVPGYTGSEAFARDEFALARIRLEGGDIPLGRRVTVSGNVQRTWAYFVGRRTTASSAVPLVEWSGGVRASVRAWGAGRFGVRLFSELRLADTGASILDDRTFGVGAAVRFR